jgi:hypothetical protein
MKRNQIQTTNIIQYKKECVSSTHSHTEQNQIYIQYLTQLSTRLLKVDIRVYIRADHGKVRFGSKKVFIFNIDTGIVLSNRVSAYCI